MGSTNSKEQKVEKRQYYQGIVVFDDKHMVLTPQIERKEVALEIIQWINQNQLMVLSHFRSYYISNTSTGLKIQGYKYLPSHELELILHEIDQRSYYFSFKILKHEIEVLV